MSNEELKKQFKNRDRILLVLSKNGHFRAALLRNTNTAKIAQEKYNLTGIPASYLARTLSGASLIASFLKGEERAIVEFQGNGVISKIYAESSHHGEVRGYLHLVANASKVEINDEKDILGDGILKVTRILYDKSHPVVGILEIQNGDIANDLTYYFNQSEQIPTAIIMDVSLSEKDMIDHSSALIVQAIPGFTLDELKSVLDSLTNIKDMSDIINNSDDSNDALHKILPFDYDIMSNKPVDFLCRCTKNKFIDALHTLSYNEIEQMQKEGQNELVCQYCNRHYYLDDNDFEKIKLAIIAKKN